MTEKKLLPSKERYREHWKQDSRFEDSIAWGIGFNACGNSFKGMMRPINVEKPHSQRHVLQLLEFGGVKDTDYNVRKAAFMEGNIVQKGIECIISRRCILIKITIGGQMRVILVKNTNASHDRDAPKALAQNLSGSIEHTPIQPPSTAPVKFEDRMTEMDVENVQAVKYLRNSITKLIDGLCFFDVQHQELGRALFQDPIKDINSAAEIKQYLMVCVFTADLEFLSRFL